jgi:hypothetical protein
MFIPKHVLYLQSHLLYLQTYDEHAGLRALALHWFLEPEHAAHTEQALTVLLE